jgi:hypothetical protein
MHGIKNYRIEPDELSNSDYNNVVYTGYLYLKGPSFGLNNSQNIVDIQDQFLTNFGVVVRYKSCCKMKI